MTNIYGVSFEELREYLSNIGENPEKAKIIFKAVYRDKITDFFQITSLNKRLLNNLRENFSLSLLSEIDRVFDETTEKILFGLEDNRIIEAVLMKQKYGNSICVSSQIGCNMACAFCRSGKNKKERNLLPFEMTAQFMYMEKTLNLKISNVTVMGIGEPFDNYENVMKFIDIITCPHGLALGMRHVSLSTCGVIPKIYEFSRRENVNSLAISLHAPNNHLRNRLMPINKSYPLEDLIKSLKYFTEKTRKKVFIEYVMLNEINDGLKQAEELANLLKGIDCTVNLIPYNDASIDGFSRSSHERVMAFYDILKQNHINVTMRREFGSDIKAACGQLKSDYIDKQNI